MIYGKVFTKTRQGLGYSQAQLAQMASVSLPTVQNLERGVATNPSIEVLEKIAHVLGLEIQIKLKDADWDLLAVCGAPLQTLADSKKKVSKENLIQAVRECANEIASGKEIADRERKEKALSALISAIHDYYPSFYKKHFSRAHAIEKITANGYDGQIIKLRRIALANIAGYL